MQSKSSAVLGLQLWQSVISTRRVRDSRVSQLAHWHIGTFTHLQIKSSNHTNHQITYPAIP